MNLTPGNIIAREKYRNAAVDLFALTFIYFVPAISHLIALPVYYLEPMRIMMIIALFHTSKKNAYLVAISLPVFSFLISAHPSIIKSLLISSELTINLFLFYLLSDKIKNTPAALFISVLASKIFYYIIKYILFSAAVLSGSFIGVPIYIQAAMLILFSVYGYAMIKKAPN